MNDAVPVLEIAGAPKQMGQALGEACRPMLPEAIEQSFRNFHEICKRKSLTYLPWERYLALGRRYLPFAEEYAPDLVEELRGCAEAAGVAFDALFAHNCWLDFDDVAYPFLADQLLFGCTAFGVTPRATADGRCYLGQNYDYRSVFKDSGLVLHLKPKRGPQALVWTMGGLMGCAGMNAAGIGLVINNLIPMDSRPGVPHAFVVRRLLQQERVGDAVAVVVGARRATGIHYTIGEASGQVIGLETTATNHESLHPTDGFLSHTNHFLTVPLRPYEKFRLPYSTDTIVRFGRMQELLGESAGHITPADLQRFLSDHVNYPFSVCRHESEEMAQDLLGKTIASLLMDLTGGVLHVAAGNPCTNPFQAITFGG